MKKVLLFGIVGFLFNLSLFASENIVYVINDNWTFVLDEAIKPTEVNWNSKKVVQIDLPHTWNNLDIIDDDPGYYRGTGWYKKELEMPITRKSYYFLKFDGANQNVDVFINGRKVGSHIGGYTAFSFNISDYLNENHKNLIEIRVDNSQNEDIPPLSADFNFFGGIYRDLSIEEKSEVIFDEGEYCGETVYWQTPEVSKEAAQIKIFGSLRNLGDKKRALIIESTVFDSDKSIVKTLNKKLKISDKGTLNFKFDSFVIKDPHLWSIEDPHLYVLRSRIIDAKTKQILDEVSSKIGLRWFSFDGEGGFFLNGKYVKIMGTARHQDFPGLGNALPKDIHYADVNRLKDMGGNFLRVAHYPQDQSILNYCDEIGILCSVEIPIVNRITESEKFTENTMNMMREMLWQNYNHPSVVIWTYMNEVLLSPRFEDNPVRQKTYFENILNLAKELETLIRTTDPYRYTMIPNHGDFELYHNVGLTGVPMIVGWNLYFGWYYDDLDDFDKFLDSFHAVLPEMPFIITEYGVGNDPRLISDSPVRFDFTNEYMLKYHSHYKKAIMERDFVSGGLIWNLNDFTSEIKIDAVPYINSKGLNTFDRKPKESYFYYKANFSSEPFVKIFSPFGEVLSGFSDEESDKVSTKKINVFSNLDSIILKHNDDNIETAAVTDGYASFMIPFTQGRNSLEVVAFNKAGNKICDIINVSFEIIHKSLKNNLRSDNDLRISCGDHRFLKNEETNKIWVPDKAYEEGGWGYVGGRKYYLETRRGLKPGSDQSIRNTILDPLYQTQRIAPKEYRFDVDEGNYEVKLCFARLSGSSQYDALNGNYEKRSEYVEKPGNFNVFLNDKIILKDFDPGETEINFAIDKVFKIKVEKSISIRFEEGRGEAVINGIVIRKLD